MRSESIFFFVSSLLFFFCGLWYWRMAKDTPKGKLVRYSENVSFSRKSTYGAAVALWFLGVFLIAIGLVL